MTQLYSRLGSLGFPRKYLREIVLPSWWDDEIAHNPAGYTEGLLLLSRNLGLDLSSMQNGAVPVGLRNLGPCKFKKSAMTSDEELMLARIVATRTVELISVAVPVPAKLLLTSATEIRQLIIRAGAPWVNLASLVDYCWSVGLPVLHVSDFPPKAKKMDGLAYARSGRSAIVLCKNTQYSAWLLFILAHELGHIVRGHINSDGVLINEQVDRNSTDAEEKVANAFALELLTGNHQSQVFAVGPVSARALAKAAYQAGVHEQINPGHIVLNYAYQMGSDGFAVANAASKQLEPHADAIGLVRSRMLAHLDKTRLSEDIYEFILQITQTGHKRNLSA
jgi:Zn-dependent peptidase ImmA (M78 family)